MDRRQLLGSIGATALTGCDAREPVAAPRLGHATLPFANGLRPLATYPGKRPLLLLTQRPPQLETPFAVFDEGPITPNDAFFVRYSMALLPLDLMPGAWRLNVSGHVTRPLGLSMAELHALPQTELVAVNQCSGNSRGFVAPRVGGGQLGHGAMGNARWTGVPLKAVLDAAGIKAGAVEVLFEGLDSPASPRSPDFAKSLAIDHARDGEVMLAWDMNGEPLPFLNGFPLRLVVPGHFGTYWVKHLHRITVLDRPFDGYFMAGTYRMPANACQCVEPGTRPAKTVPIGRYRARSFLTNVTDGTRVPTGPLALRGIAFDGGSGMRRVAVSVDGGASWMPARLGDDLGRYSFRPFTATVALNPGQRRLMVRAESMAGEQQPLTANWNPSGYALNRIETVAVTAR